MAVSQSCIASFLSSSWPKLSQFWSHPASMSPAPGEINTNQDLKQATTSKMSEHSYSLHPGHAQQQRQDLTPYSAVSSFNLPAHYDSSLITPVSMTGSPSLNARVGPPIRDERDIKLLQSSISPYHYFADDDDFGTRSYLPMKYKDPSSSLQIQTIDSPFSSPFPCPEPYFGSYSVSATPGSGRTMDSSPSIQPSPQLSSAGGLSNGSYQSHHQTPPLSATSSASYRSNAAPILIAPNPLTLRPATEQKKGPYRQNSIQSVQSNMSTLSSQGVSDTTRANSPPRGKKRKSPSISAADEDLALPDDLTPEDRLLLELYFSDLQWKERVERFNRVTGKDMKDAALQMRKKRLLDRVRENTLNVAWETGDKERFDATAEAIENQPHSKGKGTKKDLQKKWAQEHPSNSSSSQNTPENEMPPIKQETSSHTSSWPEGRRSASRNLYEGERVMSAVASPTMDELRSRAFSHSDYNISGPQYHQQQLQQNEASPRQLQQQAMLSALRQPKNEQNHRTW